MRIVAQPIYHKGSHVLTVSVALSMSLTMKCIEAEASEFLLR